MITILQAEDSTGRILIARVMHGGAADRSGLIAVGDEVSVVMMLVMTMMVMVVWCGDDGDEAKLGGQSDG